MIVRVHTRIIQIKTYFCKSNWDINEVSVFLNCKSALVKKSGCLDLWFTKVSGPTNQRYPGRWEGHCKCNDYGDYETFSPWTRGPKLGHWYQKGALNWTLIFETLCIWVLISIDRIINQWFTMCPTNVSNKNLYTSCFPQDVDKYTRYDKISERSGFGRLCNEKYSGSRTNCNLFTDPIHLKLVRLSKVNNYCLRQTKPNLSPTFRSFTSPLPWVALAFSIVASH